MAQVVGFAAASLIKEPALSDLGLSVHGGRFEKPLADKGHPRFDLYPDTTSYEEKELYAVPGLTLPEGAGPAKLFSSRNPATVRRHFHLMAEHGIDGVFLMRLGNECEVDGNPRSPLASLMRISDEKLDLVRAAAEGEGRVWALMYDPQFMLDAAVADPLSSVVRYDLSGVAPSRLDHVIRVDWLHMVVHKRILDSPNYLRENGKPVIGLKGVGINGAAQDPNVLLEIVKQLRTFTPGGAYVMISGECPPPFGRVEDDVCMSCFQAHRIGGLPAKVTKTPILASAPSIAKSMPSALGAWTRFGTKNRRTTILIEFGKM